MSKDNIAVKQFGQTTLIVVGQSMALDPEFVLKLMLDPKVAAVVAPKMTVMDIMELRRLYDHLATAVLKVVREQAVARETNPRGHFEDHPGHSATDCHLRVTVAAEDSSSDGYRCHATGGHCTPDTFCDVLRKEASR